MGSFGGYTKKRKSSNDELAVEEGGVTLALETGPAPKPEPHCPTKSCEPPVLVQKAADSAARDFKLVALKQKRENGTPTPALSLPAPQTHLVGGIHPHQLRGQASRATR